jgi:hypothetical protein
MTKSFAAILKLLWFAAFLGAVSLATGTNSFAASNPPKGYILPSQCGGVGQRTCELSEAWYLGKVKRSKPSRSAFFDPRNGGEWWECPSDRPRRTLYKVTDKRACATKKIIGEKLSKAKNLGKTKNNKPSGAFVDPRNGGEFWRCPTGFWRNLNAVTAKAACTVTVGENCDRGNIAIAGALFKGEDITKYSCYKKLACGNEKQRPCQITERIPSCNKGLAEDFIANECINTTLAACLTGVRTVHFAIKIADGLTPLEKEILKVVQKMAKDILYIIPGMKKLVQAGEKEIKKAATKAEDAAKKELDKILSKVKIFKKIESTMTTLAKTVDHNRDSLQSLLIKDSFFTMDPNDRAAAMAQHLGVDLRKIEVSGPTSYAVGISAGPTKDHITIGVGIDYVFDTTGKSAFYMNFSAGATSGDDSPLDVSLNIGVMPDTAYNDAGGSAIALGYGADFGAGIAMSNDVSMNLNWGDKKTPVSFGGVSIGFGKGGDTSSLDFSGSFNQSVMIADMK